MAKVSNQELITQIQNGNQEILFYLSKKYFQPARRMLRRKGISDQRTPVVFSEALVHVYREIQQHQLSPNIDLESYLFNVLEESVRTEKKMKRENKLGLKPVYSDDQRQIVSDCVGILDKQAQQLLFAKYSENLSFEQIAARFEFSNPVIAQFEVNKAYKQLEGIAGMRLNPEPN